MDDEEDVLSILTGRVGCEDQYSTISEFNQHLNVNYAALAVEELVIGWVLWRENEIQQQHKIITLLKHIASDWRVKNHYHSLIQFWGVVKVEGRPHYLSTSHHPFCVPSLKKGLCWYRKLCMDREVTHVDVEEQLGRAYRNKRPESTPDLRLYSTNEFPLRDEAARCGFRGFMALPLFDLHTSECYGVLELLANHPLLEEEKLRFLYQGLQIAGLKSTHMSCFSTIKHTLDNYEQPDNEITEILELAIRAVPRLSLAQVWNSCKQCRTDMSLRCMEMASYICAENKTVSSESSDVYLYSDIDDCDICCYLQACKFHNLQIGLTCMLQNISDLSISKSPLAHYAKKARLSHCLTICLQSVNNSNDSFVIIQFFLQLKVREDAYGDSSVHSLLKIIQMKLKSFKLVSMEQLPEELVVQSRQTNATEYEYTDVYNVMNSYKDIISERVFATYLESSRCLRPSSYDSDEGWVFRSPAGEALIENNVQSNLSVVPSLIKEKIEQFMKTMAVKIRFRIKYWIIQFWMPKMVKDRYCLETLDQPYVVGCLGKGLALFRKKCTKHHYFVDDEATEEELGPPGRVFRNEHPEITPSLYLYSTKEFPMRNYALHYQLKEYFALPIFYECKCVGVLEFMGKFYDDLYAKDIERALKAAGLSSSRIDLRPRFKSDDNIPANITEALAEVKGAFSLIVKIPQLHLAKVWVPYERYASTIMNSNVRYMELALTTEDMWNEEFTDEVHWINYVHSKKGMIGMLLESEDKSCFCPNLSEFSIADQPLAHVEREERLDVCFAICLQSSHTEDLPYVVEFFLNPSLNYLSSFLSFLLPIMSQQLQSFKYSCGKQITEKLVVEVIEFYGANNPAFSELGQLDGFPIEFKRVQYGRTEHQQVALESVLCVSDARQTEQCNTASDFKKTNSGKRKTGFHLSREAIMSHFGKKNEAIMAHFGKKNEAIIAHFGKKQKDAAKELGGTVGISTLKRRCRDYGIHCWPSNEKQAGNPSLYQRKNGQDMQPSSSTNLQLMETSLCQNAPHTNTESMQHRVVQEVAEKMIIIKVNFEEDIIKFELCLSLGLAKLFEEAATRLKLEMGTFKLKYFDEDGEEILLTCDADLQYCSKSQITMGKAYIQLFVRR